MEASRYPAATQAPRRTVAARGGPRRLTSETKQAFKTTEFWAYVAILIGLFLAGVIADADEGSEVDGFGANQVWLYAVLLTFGYMVSRGLAKSGSRDPYWDEPDTSGGEGGIGERVKAAAQVLREGEGAGGSTGESETRRQQY